MLEFDASLLIIHVTQFIVISSNPNRRMLFSLFSPLHQSGRIVPFLRARVGRQVQGMDLGLYEQSVRIRRAFLEHPNGILFPKPQPTVATSRC